MYAAKPVVFAAADQSRLSSVRSLPGVCAVLINGGFAVRGVIRHNARSNKCRLEVIE